MQKMLLILIYTPFSQQNSVNDRITVLVASDISQKYINTTIKWLYIAEKEWFAEDILASNLFYPILLVMAGNYVKYEDLNKLGFKNSFVNNFKKPYQYLIQGFNKFTKQPIRKILKIIQ